MDDFCGSKFWDSNLTWFSVNPYFTKCFEETVLIWVPCAFFWTFVLVDVYYLKISSERNIPWNKLNISKLILTAVLLILTAVDFSTAFIITMAGGTSKFIYPVDIWTPVIKFATFFLLLVFIPLNRKYGVQTSGCNFLFWFILVIFSIPRCRTEVEVANLLSNILNSVESKDIIDVSWKEYKYVSFMFFFAISCAMLLLNCFADAVPRITKHNRTTNEIPETSASFPSRLTYLWFEKLVWKGFRKPLQEDDLWDLRAQDSCKEIIPTFAKNWNKNVCKQRQLYGSLPEARFSNGRNTYGSLQGVKTKYGRRCKVSIMPPIVHTFGCMFLATSFLRLCSDLLMFTQPQVLGLLIAFIEDSTGDEAESTPKWHGIFYSVLLFFIAATQTILLHQYFHRVIVVGFRIRTALIDLIFRKAMVISNVARRESTLGEIVNLMAVDTQRVIDFSTFANTLWSSPLQIALALYFLWQLLGPSVLAGVAVLLIMIILNGAIANRLKSHQVRQMIYKDERIKLLNEIMSGIKVLKFYAWEPIFERQVKQIRDKEMATLKSSASYTAGTSWVSFSATVLVSVATFATYVLIDDSHTLDATKIFVSLSLFHLLRIPLLILPATISNFVQTQVSVHRINRFMNSDELDPDSVQHDPNGKHPLVIDDGTFSWGDDQSALKDINIKVPKGKLYAIVGTVGAGKSTVIQAFLGEIDKVAGRVNTLGSIAYVPQQAWIQNATLRDNILFGRPYKSKFYNRVIVACALNADIDALPAGDLTEIGEKGINLSGGQKQRVSLARALYSNAELYLLDDPLSAVDSHVGKHIFEEVIGPKGMLAKKTRLLVTHGITFLPKTDFIYVLKSGEISESGTYEQLWKSKGAFADFLLLHLHESSLGGADLDEIQQRLNTAVEPNEMTSRLSRAVSIARSEGLADSESIKSTDSLRRRKPGRTQSESSVASTLSQKSQLSEKHGKLMDVEKTEKGSVQFTVYKYYMQKIGVLLTTAAFVLYFIFEIFQVGSNLWLVKWANDEEVDSDTKLRDLYLHVYAFLGFAQCTTSLMMSLAPAFGALRASNLLHTVLLANILRAPMSFFDTTPQGRILSRFSSDIETTDRRLAQVITECLWCIFEVTATIVVISISTPIFLAAVIPISLLYYCAQRLYVPTSRQLIRIESISRSPIYSHFGETIAGASSIRAYSVQERFIDELDAKVDKNVIAKYPGQICKRWLAVRLEMIGNLIILFASLFAVLAGQTNAGLVGLSVTYALQVTQTLNWLVRMTSNLETNIVAVERVKEYAEVQQEAPWFIEKPKVPRDWPFKGRIVFNNLNVRYREGLDLVLQGISFTIQGGEKVGIVGRTGSGKSSLTLSLFRIIEAAGGRILIDGVDISTVGLHVLRSRITIIPQDPILFSGSLRKNLDPYEKYSDDDIWRALELAHIRKFIKKLPTGLHYKISEGGDNLSVGQRQLLCLARALLRETKVLILDEATASIDLDTDALIQRTVRTEFKGCTVLTIAHRLNTVMESDKVVVLDKGKIVEFDAPAVLLENPQSVFYRMTKDADLH